MILSEFLKKYRTGVNEATGAGLSIRALSQLIGVDNVRLTKWEGSDTVRGSLPKHHNDIIALKMFFGIDNFTNISETSLGSAIARYPHGLGKMEDLANVKAIEIPLKQTNINVGKENINGELKKKEGAETGDYQETMVNSQSTQNTRIMESKLLLELSMKMADNEARLLAIVDRLTGPGTTIQIATGSLNRGKRTVVKE